MIQLYYKTTTPGGKATYHKLTPDSFKSVAAAELTDRQAVTMAASLAYTVVNGAIATIPEHKRIRREIENMMNALVKGLRAKGQSIDDELATHVMESWNLAMTIGELTYYEKVAP